MKNKKVWYLGYVIAALSLIVLVTLKLDRSMQIILIFVFAIASSVSHVQIMHHKMMEKDEEYRINVNDERTEKIRDKVNAMMCAILMLLISMVAVICIVIKNYVPAGLLGLSVVLSPIIMYFINSYYEKKY